MDLGYSVPELASAIHETVAVNSMASCYVRPIAFRGAGPMGLYPRDNPVEIAVAVWPWGAYLGEEALEHGVSCKVSSFRRIGPNTLPPPPRRRASTSTPCSRSSRPAAPATTRRSS